MKRLVALSLLLLILVGLAVPAGSQGPGLFIRVDCTTITAPVTGQTWCFDATAQVPKVWNGSAYVQAPAAPATVVGSYALRNLVGQNNSIAPNTSYDYSADLVELRNPTDASVVVRTNTGVLSNNILLAFTVNGRDQAAAYSASTWIHFYFAWNGTTLGTLSSTTAPPTGPALPTGFTHWAYVGAVFNNATPLLVKTRMRGAWMEYEGVQTVLAGGTATAETAIDLTTFIPPNALQVKTLVAQYTLTTSAGGVISATVVFRYVSGSTYYAVRTIRDGLGAATVQTDGDWVVIFPNLAQNLFYLWTVTTGTAQAISLYALGYSVPNGGE